MTSSLLSPITGKREWRVSTTSGMKSGTASSTDTQSICERGIMMSRTVRLGDRQHALDHRQRVGVEQVALERAAQDVEQLLAVLGLAQEHRRDALHQRRLVAVVVLSSFVR